MGGGWKEGGRRRREGGTGWIRNGLRVCYGERAHREVEHGRDHVMEGGASGHVMEVTLWVTCRRAAHPVT